jgi:hypothetical protein
MSSKHTKSVSFTPEELYLRDYAENSSNGNFSYYIKQLIKQDMRNAQGDPTQLLKGDPKVIAKMKNVYLQDILKEVTSMVKKAAIEIDLPDLRLEIGQPKEVLLNTNENPTLINPHADEKIKAAYQIKFDGSEEKFSVGE